MNPREVARQFDRHLESAKSVLDAAAIENSDAITPERSAELSDALENLYLPNVDFYGNAYVNFAMHPDDKIAFLPSKARPYAKRFVIEDSDLDPIEYPDYCDQTYMLVTGRLISQPDTDNLRRYNYSIVEPHPKPRTNTWNKYGAILLHELVHTRQAFRKSTTGPVPGRLFHNPILRSPDFIPELRNEVEAYWLQTEVADPETREQIQRQADQIQPYLNHGKPPYVNPEVSQRSSIAFTSLIRSMMDLKLISAEKNPHPDVADFLLANNII